MQRQVVVAHYNEDLKWLSCFSPDDRTKIRVYDKGGYNFHVSGYDYCRLDNVGREAHTYLHHIATYYDSLADLTLFCQGDNDDHNPTKFPIQNLLDMPEKAEMGGFFLLSPVREWDQSGRMAHYGKWADMCKDGAMCLSDISFTQWWKMWLGKDLWPTHGIAYYPGAVFAVTKEAIRRTPRGRYEALLKSIPNHVNPEVAYFLERAWPHLFQVPPEKMAAVMRR